MSVEYPIESLASRLQLTAIHALHGMIINEDLHWQIIAKKNGEVLSQSEAQPTFDLHPGSYDIKVEWGQRQLDAGAVILKRGYCVDVVVMFQEFGEPDADEGYFVDPEEVTREAEYARRQLERDAQRQFGVAADALADPNPPQGEMGQSMLQHPTLAASAQHDGVAPEVSRDPVINVEESEKSKEHQLQKQAQLQNAQQNVATMSPYH